jgi:hypothetical protein
MVSAEISGAAMKNMYYFNSNTASLSIKAFPGLSNGKKILYQ